MAVPSQAQQKPIHFPGDTRCPAIGELGLAHEHLHMLFQLAAFIRHADGRQKIIH